MGQGAGMTTRSVAQAAKGPADALQWIAGLPPAGTGRKIAAFRRWGIVFVERNAAIFLFRRMVILHAEEWIGILSEADGATWAFCRVEGGGGILKYVVLQGKGEVRAHRRRWHGAR